MTCYVYSMLCVWQLIIYISGYYIGFEKYINYFMVNMTLDTMIYGDIINSYYRMVVEWNFYSPHMIRFIRQCMFFSS